jgi:hypothetical protein
MVVVRRGGERGAIYISTGDHIPLRLGQGRPHIVQVRAMPVEQLTDRVILKHPKVTSPRFVGYNYMRSEPGRRVLQ